MSPEERVLQVVERTLGFLTGDPDPLASEVESVELATLLSDMDGQTLTLAFTVGMVVQTAAAEEAARRA